MLRTALTKHFAILALAALAGGVLPAQEDLGTKVSRLLGEADAAPLVRAFELGRQVSDLQAQEDALVKAISESASKLGNHGRIAAGSALIDIGEGETHGQAVLETLRPVCKSEDPLARAAALALLGKKHFARKTLIEVQSLVKENVVADTLEPQVRLAACRTLWELGSDEQRSLARQTIAQYLASTDNGLRTQGALALAEINQVNREAKAILQALAVEPTTEGKLAKSYLAIENLQREFEARLRKLTEQQLAEPNGKQSDELKVLREIMARVHVSHVRGEKVPDEFLISEAAKGMAAAVDRHSSFFTSEEFQKFFFDLNREYGGIGAFVNFDQDDIFSIVRPIYSGPAYRAGLKSGDKLLEVDGWETSGHSSDEIIAKLKGQPGTKVTIKFRRLGLPEAKEVTLTREEIQVPSVNFDMLPGKVGYLECLTFGQNTADEMRHAIDHLQEQGAKALVLDLRNNTGGYLLAARDVVELFVPGAKLVVYTEGRSTQREEYKTRNQAVVPEMPLVVLVNEFSASASEITAGALQDHKRATIVGKRSFGKGSVQSLIELKTARGEVFDDKNGNGTRDEWEPYTDANKNGKYDVGPRLKLTVARYYLPSGRCLHKDIDEATGKVVNPDWGIVPDREVELREFSTKELWKNAEVFELLQKDVFRKYARAHLDQNKELFLQLADGDRGDFTKYPEFEQFYSSLDTKLSKDDVRRWLRWTLRDEVADARGKAYPGGRALGDYQEDGQLQEAMKALFEKLGQDIKQLPEFQGGVLKVAQDKKPEEAKKKG